MYVVLLFWPDRSHAVVGPFSVENAARQWVADAGRSHSHVSQAKFVIDRLVPPFNTLDVPPLMKGFFVLCDGERYGPFESRDDARREADRHCLTGYTIEGTVALVDQPNPPGSVTEPGQDDRDSRRR